jgi:peptide deformylase
MLAIDDLVFKPLPRSQSLDIVRDVSEVREYVPAMLGWVRRSRMNNNTTHYALAAPLIGLNKRLIVTDGFEDYPRVFINPIVVGFGPCIAERHEHVSIHAFNFKWEQSLLCTTEGYYADRERCGLDMAYFIQGAYEVLNSYK